MSSIGASTRVLFVDDEALLLQGYARRLRQLRRPEKPEFADGATNALAILQATQASPEAQPFDAIVSDLRMPGMDGAALLESVAQHWPSMVRVLLSGQTDLLAPTHIEVAHRRFTKPCDLQVVMDAIDLPVRLAKQLDGGASGTASLRARVEREAIEWSIARISAELGLPTHAPLDLTAAPWKGERPPAPLLQAALALGPGVTRAVAYGILAIERHEPFLAGAAIRHGGQDMYGNYEGLTGAFLRFAALEAMPFFASRLAAAAYLFALWGVPAAVIDAVLYDHAGNRSTTEAEHAIAN